MKTSTVVALVVIAGGLWYANRQGWLTRAIQATSVTDPGPSSRANAVPVANPGGIADPENPTQTGYTTGIKNPLSADQMPIFSGRRSRRNSIVAY